MGWEWAPYASKLCPVTHDTKFKTCVSGITKSVYLVYGLRINTVLTMTRTKIITTSATGILVVVVVLSIRVVKDVVVPRRLLQLQQSSHKSQIPIQNTSYDIP